MNRPIYNPMCQCGHVRALHIHATIEAPCSECDCGEFKERTAARGRHLIVQKWLAGETDAGGCINELEQALIRAELPRADEVKEEYWRNVIRNAQHYTPFGLCAWGSTGIFNNGEIEQGCDEACLWAKAQES